MFYLLTIFLLSSNTILFSKGVFAQEQTEELLVNSKIEKKKFIDKLSQLYDYVQSNYYKNPDANDALEGALQGMLENLSDPYSTYIPKEDTEKYTESITGEFGGLGITIDEGLDIESGVHYIKVISPIEGTPAFYAGLQSGDLVVSVDDTSTAEMSSQDAVLIMRGTPGTSVDLVVKRGGTLFPVSIVRDIIKVIYLKHAHINDDIAYISLLSFNNNTPRKFLEALQSLNEVGYKHLILDLRNNPGGSLDAVLKISDFFLEQEELIVGTSSRIVNNREQYFAKTSPIVSSEKKIVVLINSGTASASEILAGALRFNDKAVLVGENSYGKGLIQTVQAFGEGIITLTVAEYFAPGDRFINELGIPPDIELTGVVFDNDPQERVWLSKINEQDLVRKFVEEKKGKIDDAAVSEFKKRLRKEGANFKNDNLIIRMLKVQAQSFNNEIAIYDLGLDSVLNTTVQMIMDGDL